ncbi:MAG: hypothetical protein HY565_03805 [Candidatus Kerfeldbacteria bacterium]|nr:hypothetical protein [Candidatus Kerfeldbacteria bacterium]
MTLLKLQSILASVVIVSCIGLAQPVAAANWGDCSVESGTTAIADTSTLTTVTPATTISDTSQAFVIASATGDVNVRETKDHLMTAKLLNTGSVEFERGGNVGELHITYSIVQCQGGDKIAVQRGDISLSAGVASATGTLTTAVDTSYSLVTVTVSSDGAGTADADNLVTAALQDTSTVVAQRATAATSKINAHYQVIEFPSSAGVSVQTSEATLSPGSASTAVTLTTAVATDRTWVYCSYDATDNGLQQTAVGCALTDASTVTIYRYAASAYTNRVRVYAVTWPGDTVTVLSGTDSVDPAVADGNQFTHSITLSDPGADTSRSFPYLTNTTSGTTAPHPYPSNRWGAYLLDSDTLEIVFWRSDPTGSTDAANFYWQVINFPPPYIATGWGWIGNSEVTTDGGTALISFSCDNLTTYTGQDCGDGTAGTRYDYGVTLERGGCGSDCDISGQAWIGDTYDKATEPVPSPIGIIDFDPDVSSGPPLTIGDDTTTIEDETVSAHWNEETGEVYGWARFRALEDYEADTLGGTDNDWGWIKLRGTESSGGSEYGVQFSADTLEFSGWSWNDNGTQVGTAIEEEGSGFGWVKFDLDSSTSGTVGDAWLRTTQADVYSQGGFSSTIDPTTFSEYNSTYLIITSGDSTTINGFSTQLGSQVTGKDLGGVPTDSTATTQVFRGDLGTIYVNELIGQADHNQVGCTDSFVSGDTNPLGGDIFYCAGDMTINNNLTFYNGTGSTIGSGTIVVDGDLYINDNLNYFNSTIDQHINNLASVAWIVTGRVIIDPAVTDLVGAFIVLGDADPATTSNYDFDTGSSTLPLTLHGLVMARSFNFQRTSVGTATDPEPGEDIRYDGRVFANPPPGLEDLASLLPEFD